MSFQNRRYPIQQILNPYFSISYVFVKFRYLILLLNSSWNIRGMCHTDIDVMLGFLLCYCEYYVSASLQVTDQTSVCRPLITSVKFVQTEVSCSRKVVHENRLNIYTFDVTSHGINVSSIVIISRNLFLVTFLNSKVQEKEVFLFLFFIIFL